MQVHGATSRNGFLQSQDKLIAQTMNNYNDNGTCDWFMLFVVYIVPSALNEVLFTLWWFCPKYPCKLDNSVHTTFLVYTYLKLSAKPCIWSCSHNSPFHFWKKNKNMYSESSIIIRVFIEYLYELLVKCTSISWSRCSLCLWHFWVSIWRDNTSILTKYLLHYIALPRPLSGTAPGCDTLIMGFSPSYGRWCWLWLVSPQLSEC